MRSLVAAFFFVLVLSPDGDAWLEMGPFSSLGECVSSKFAYVDSECYFKDGNVAEHGGEVES